jgi:ribonuclease HI
MATISLELGNEKPQKLIVSSIYMPSTRFDEINKKTLTITEPVTDEIIKLIKNCRTNKLDLIIGADANAHNTLWGSRTTDYRGSKLEELIGGNHLKILNQGEYPTFDNGRASSCIDVTLALTKSASKISDWKVLKDYNGSDHNTISLKFDTLTCKQIGYRDKKSTDWIKYIKYVKADCAKVDWYIESTTDLDEKADKLGKILLSAHERACRIRKIKQFDGIPWVNGEVKNARKNMRKNLNRRNRNCSIDDADALSNNFRASRNHYGKIRRKAKTTSWKNKVEEIEGTKDIARLYKLFNNKSHNVIGNIQRDDGTFTSNTNELVKELMTKHFPDCIEITENEAHDTEPGTCKYNAATIAEIVEAINENSIRIAIKDIGPFKSPGDDQIFPALLQKPIDHIVGILGELFRASVLLSHIPKAWRGTRITFIPKVGRTDVERAKSMRPISLMSFLLKFLEKVINDKIRTTYLVDNDLSDHQHAYRRQRGTDSALHAIINPIERNLAHKGVTVAVFIDIEGAFDNTGFNTIVEAAQKKGLPQWITDWILSMLNSRELQASMSKEAIKFCPMRGCPQGGVLSPLLWCLVVDSLIIKLTEAGMVVTGFADDLTIQVSAEKAWKSVDAYEHLGRGMRIVENWCKETKLNVNPDKSALICFKSSKSIKNLRTAPVVLFGKEIKQVESTKTLGLTVDETLNWKKHINNKLEACHKSLWAARAYVAKTWGISPKAMLWIYEQIILPKLMFAALIWWHKAQNSENCKALDSLQRKALMLVTGAVSSTPGAPLEALLNLTPLNTRIKYAAANTFHRLQMSNLISKQFDTHPKCHTSISTTVSYVCDKYEIHQENIYNNTLQHKKIIGERANWAHGLTRNSAYNWYIDGSKNATSTGVGITDERGYTQLSLRVPDNFSILNAEMTGIIRCAEIIKDSSTTNRTISFLMDNIAAIKLLSNQNTNSPLGLRAQNAISELAKRNTIEVRWVPGHNNIRGNVEADRLAKEALRSDSINEICKMDWREASKLEENIEAKKKWNEIKHKFRFSNDNIRGYSSETANHIVKSNRLNARIIIGMYTGHGCLKNFLFKIGKSDDNLCNRCKKEPEDMEHILFKCKHTDMIEARQRLFNKDATNLLDTEPDKLLKFAKLTSLDETFKRDQ